MQKIFWAFIIALSVVATAAWAKTANHNIVVQSYKDVQRNQMFEPGFNPGGSRTRVKRNTRKQEEASQSQSQTQTQAPVIAVSEPDEKPAENYNENIAAELFKKDMSPITVELSKANTNLKINVGQPLQIILPGDEEASIKWNYTNNEFKYVRIIEDYHYMGQRILNAEVFGQGEEQIFFDLMDNNGEEIKVLGSKVLNITAE